MELGDKSMEPFRVDRKAGISTWDIKKRKGGCKYGVLRWCFNAGSICRRVSTADFLRTDIFKI